MRTASDVAVIGGGLVGLTFANALAKTTNLRVTLIEGREPVQPEANVYGLRVSAITRASQKILESVGAWSHLPASVVRPFRHMHVWDATQQQSLDFNAQDIFQTHLGCIVENHHLQQALLKAAEENDAIHWCCPARVESIQRKESGWSLSLDNGKRVQAQLIVGADGAHSWLREQMGIPVKIKDYDQSALVTTVHCSEPNASTAWQCFHSRGPLAFLPLSGSQDCSIVWSTTHEEAKALQALSDEELGERLSEAFFHRLGNVKILGARAAFPLRRRHAQYYVADGVALLGDAVRTIHPLAGQGANLGFMDAACLAEVLSQAVERGRDFSARDSLRPYERSRKEANLMMLAAMDGFRYLFSGEQAYKVSLRGLGLRAVDCFDVLKNQLVRYAMGLTSDLPAIARQWY